MEIFPLSERPDVKDICIGWGHAEWGKSANFTHPDWLAEFQRIETHPVEEVFVAFQSDTPVGMVWLLEHEDVDSHRHLTPWLSSLVVDPTHRMQGIANALMAHLEAYAALGGDETLHLLTKTPAVYFTKGWEITDIARLGDRLVYVMQKSLVEAGAIAV